MLVQYLFLMMLVLRFDDACRLVDAMLNLSYGMLALIFFACLTAAISLSPAFADDIGASLQASYEVMR